MTPHFWQQTQNYITKNLGENVAINVLVFGWQEVAKSSIIDEICAFCERK